MSHHAGYSVKVADAEAGIRFLEARLAAEIKRREKAEKDLAHKERQVNQLHALLIAGRFVRINQESEKPTHQELTKRVAVAMDALMNGKGVE